MPSLDISLSLHNDMMKYVARSYNQHKQYFIYPLQYFIYNTLFTLYNTLFTLYKYHTIFTILYILYLAFTY